MTKYKLKQYILIISTTLVKRQCYKSEILKKTGISRLMNNCENLQKKSEEPLMISLSNDYLIVGYVFRVSLFLMTSHYTVAVKVH